MDTKNVEHIDVEYVADLARISLSAEETERYQRELDRIVDYVHLLDELDVSGIDPTAHPFPVTNVFREDQARDGMTSDEVVANAPDATEDGAIRVPAILPGQEGA